MKIKTLFIMLILVTALLASGCADKKKVVTDPSGQNITRPALTPEQAFALAKLGTQTAVQVLDVRIAALEKDKETNAGRLRILRAAKAILDEFTDQVADVTSITLDTKEKVYAAVGKALTGADNLAAKDVLELNDSEAQAYARAAIGVARSALESVKALFLDTPEIKSN